MNVRRGGLLEEFHSVSKLLFLTANRDCLNTSSLILIELLSYDGNSQEAVSQCLNTVLKKILS